MLYINSNTGDVSVYSSCPIYMKSLSEEFIIFGLIIVQIVSIFIPGRYL